MSTLQITSLITLTQELFDQYTNFVISSTSVLYINIGSDVTNQPLNINANKNFYFDPSITKKFVTLRPNNFSMFNFTGDYTVTFGTAATKNNGNTFFINALNGLTAPISSNVAINRTGGNAFTGGMGTVVNYAATNVTAGTGGSGSYFGPNSGAIINGMNAGSANGGYCFQCNLINYGTMTVLGGKGGNSIRNSGSLDVQTATASTVIGNAGDANGGDCIIGNLINSGTMIISSGPGGNYVALNYPAITAIAGSGCPGSVRTNNGIAGNGGSANSGNCVTGSVINSGTMTLLVTNAGANTYGSGSSCNMTTLGNGKGGSANSGYAIKGPVTNSGTMTVMPGNGGGNASRTCSSFVETISNATPIAKSVAGSAICGGGINPDGLNTTNNSGSIIAITIAKGGNTGTYSGFGTTHGPAYALPSLAGQINNSGGIRSYSSIGGGNSNANIVHSSAYGITGTLANSATGIVYSQGGAANGTMATAAVGFYGVFDNYGFMKPTGGMISSGKFATNFNAVSTSYNRAGAKLNICGGQPASTGTVINNGTIYNSWASKGNCGSAPNPTF